MSCEILEILIPIICIPNYHQIISKKEKRKKKKEKKNYHEVKTTLNCNNKHEIIKHYIYRIQTLRQ